MVMTVGRTATGIFEYTASSIAVAADDEICWLFTTGTGTFSISVQMIAVEYEATNTTDGYIGSGSMGATAEITQAGGVTNYYILGGGFKEAITNETQAQLKTREAFTFHNLTITVRANAANASSTFKFRKNAEM